MSYLDRFLDFLNSLPDCLIYFLLGLSAFIENIFPPIPGDTVTAFGAFLVGTKKLSFLWVYTATTVGSLLGFMTLFQMGTLLGRRFFIERDYLFFKAKDIIKAENWFRKYGYLLILLNRFFPGIRSAISISGGISGLNPLKSAFLALLSCGVWNLIWIFLGYTLGNNWEKVRDRLGHIMARYNLAVLIFIGLVILVFLARKLLKKR